MRTSKGYSVRQRASTIIRLVADTSGGERIFATATAACTVGGGPSISKLTNQQQEKLGERVDRALPSESKGHTFESCRVRHGR